MDGWIGSLSGFFDGYNYHQGPVSIRIEENKIVEIEFASVNHPLIDGRGKILMPPFSDGHTHLIFGGTRFSELTLKLSGRSYSEILDQGGGIQSTVKATRSASDDLLKELVTKRLDVMLAHGSTMVEIKSGYGLSTHHELRLLEILNDVNQFHPVEIIPTFGAAHVYPQEVPQEEYLSQIIDEMLPQVSKRSLATSTDVFCDKGAFSIEDTIAIFEASERYNLPVRVHAEELEYRGIAALASSKFSLLSADHLLHARKSDFESLAENNCVAMFMPLAPFGLFSNQYPTGFDIDGLNIGLGSDFNPNNWSVSMQSAIRMAVFKYRMHPLDAIKSAINGSYQGITGKPFAILEEGSEANFILVSSDSPEEFVSKFGQNSVTHVVKKGRILVENTHPMV